ncbi:MAG: glutamate--tRNA ligase [Oscillospiraceae bacterium]|nr:glutamate--tRNA ligase [Oscillospiraceae bacterium]
MEKRIPKGRTRTRFAPSPTGYMHVGGLRTALYAYLIAKMDGGQFILRIEDTDQGRYVEGATEIIYKTLLDAGLVYDEGPDKGGSVGPYTQSERREIYHKYAERLIELGGAYIRDDEPGVVRQKIPADGSTSFTDTLFGEVTISNSELDEGVLIKSDGMPTYNFANVIDDHLMGITHIVRGTEYLTSTPKYNLLYEAFGWDIPIYIHVSPVMKNAAQKLSKRNGDPTYEDLLDMGYLKEAVLNYVALLGWSPGGEREIFSLKELEETFNVSGLSKSPAIFDMEKLTWLNGEYIRALSSDRFYELALPYIKRYIKREVDSREVALMVQSRCGRLTDIRELTDFIDKLPEYSKELFIHKKMKTDVESSIGTLRHIYDALSALDEWTAESVHTSMTALVAELGLKNGQVLFPLRVAVSGKESTPAGGTELCALLGKEESLKRIAKAVGL